MTAIFFPEIGIRTALGAGRRDVLTMVFRRGLRLAGLGLAIGLVLAAAASQLLASLLCGVSPLDPLTFGSVAAAALAVSALATWLPARRAIAVDPLSALRRE